MSGTIDVVVTRYNEPLLWLEPLLNRAGWHSFVYSPGRAPSRALCAAESVSCIDIPNAGYEWHGYLRHIISRYTELADRTIFLQGDPFTVSPDIHCLLDQTAHFAPVQALSWVQQSKKKMELFQQLRRAFRTHARPPGLRVPPRAPPRPCAAADRCNVSHLRGCTNYYVLGEFLITDVTSAT